MNLDDFLPMLHEVAEPTRTQIEQRALPIIHNPLFRQYGMRWNHEKPPVCNTEPWHAFASRLVTGMQLLAALIPSINVKLEGFGEIDLGYITKEKMMLNLFDIVMDAPVYLWSTDMLNLAQAAPLPPHTISSQMLVRKSMYWTFESAFKGEHVEKGSRYETQWFYLVEQDTTAGMWTRLFSDAILFDKNGEPTDQRLIAFAMMYGKSWPRDWTDQTDQVAVGNFLKYCAFLASPFIDKTPQRLPRHQRRQLERAGQEREQVNRDTTVTILRRKVPGVPTKRPPQGETDWQHQWWVSGHYRAQWYPSDAAHRVIWIAPFLKGPSDKPLLDKMYSVIR